MTTEHTASTATDERTLRELAVDTLRGAAHLSHEARLLKTLATDAAEDAVHSAQRTIKRGRQTALDARDEAIYRVKREPIKAMAWVFGAGAVFGLVFGLACPRGRTRK
jgi:hypothetical protein